MNLGGTGELLAFARDELLRRVSNARERIWLCSPFLTDEVAEQIAEAKRKLIGAG